MSEASTAADGSVESPALCASVILVCPSSHQTARRFIAFRKGRDLLHNPILSDGEVLRTQSGNVVSVLVRHRNIELNQVDDHVKVRAVLRADGSFICPGIEPEESESQKTNFLTIGPKGSYSASSLPETAASACIFDRDRTSRSNSALTLVGDLNLPARKSSPASCIARRSAGQSSKSVAKIFSTISRVSSGTRRLSITGEYPPSSAKRAQYRLGESQDSARNRLEYPENGGMGAMFNSSRP